MTVRNVMTVCHMYCCLYVILGTSKQQESFTFHFRIVALLILFWSYWFFDLLITLNLYLCGI